MYAKRSLFRSPNRPGAAARARRDGKTSGARRPGFTFVELVLGLAVTAIVGAAAASVMLAVGRGWTAGGTASNSDFETNQVLRKLQKIVGNACLVAAGKATRAVNGTSVYTELGWAPGTTDGSSAAALMLWLGDENSDGKIQLSEEAEIRYDAATRQLLLYTIAVPGGVSDTTRSDDCLYDPTEPAGFLTLPYLTAQVLAEKVVGVQLHPMDSLATRRPVVEFRIAFGRGATDPTTVTELAYLTVTVRSAAQLPLNVRDGLQQRI